jgi:hypothetical protein
MTVSTTIIKNFHNGNASTTNFAYQFRILEDTDLLVIIRTNSTGAETTKTLSTHYTVAGAGDASGGSITFTAGNTPAIGETVVIRRNVPQTQAIDYIANDPFPAETHEEGLDRGTMVAQQVAEESDRSIKLSRTNTMTSTEFTVGATDRANKVLAFDSAGEISVTQELGTFKGSDTTTTTAAYVQRDIIKSTTAGQLNNVYICVADSIIGDTLTDTDHFALLVDAVSAAASEVAAAASAAAAQLSADDAAADLVLTNADVVSTNADVVLTNADVVSTNADAAATAADLVATNQDTIDTAADLVATNQDTIDTAADLVATNQDTIDTAADVVLTHADVLLTNADVVLTHADVVLTNADVVSTGLDKAATNADVLLTAADVISSAASAAAAAASADAFDDVYLGSKSSDPTTDNDGDPLAAGMLYYNSVSNIMRIYSGSAWENVAVSASGFATLTGVETLTNKTINGSNNTISNVPNSALIGSGAITINGSAVSLGGSITVGETKPTISSISPDTIDNTEATITITGANFVSVPQVEFLNPSTGIWYTASTVTFNNSTSLTVTITLSVDATYKIRIENPDGNAVISFTNILTVSDAPTWTTAAGTLGTIAGDFSGTVATVVATSDSAVTYSEVTSPLVLTNAAQANCSLNSTTGVITTTDFGGASTTATTYNFTIRATDAEGQTADRSFSLTSSFGATGGGQFN